tara:strand:+ start:505 stop:1032 length:528 start_codon:yes stop_codon:yes gene_type:complete
MLKKMLKMMNKYNLIIIKKRELDIIMIYKIYCIIDINGLKYVGKTYKTLKERLKGHKADKKLNKGCSSEKLDLYNCQMILLCECEEHEAKYREQYFKDNIKCVNKYNPVYNEIHYHRKYRKKWLIKNKDHRKQYEKEWYENNKEKIYIRTKERDLFRKISVVNGCYEFIQMLKQY